MILTTYFFSPTFEVSCWLVNNEVSVQSTTQGDEGGGGEGIESVGINGVPVFSG